MSKQRRKATHVYLFRLGDYHKVGSSCSPGKRLYDFTRLPYPGELLHHFPSDNALLIERALQDRLEQYSVGYEWFSLPQPFVDAVCRIERCDSLGDLPAELHPGAGFLPPAVAHRLLRIPELVLPVLTDHAAKIGMSVDSLFRLLLRQATDRQENQT